MGKEVSSVGTKVNSATSAFSKLGSVGSSALSKITSGTSAAITGVAKLGTTATTTSKNLGNMGTEGAKAGTSISKSMGGAGQAVDGLGSAMAGIAGGFGLMTIAGAAWSGSTQAQFNKAYLATKVGTKAADQYVKSIQQIVSEVPGDDTFMNQILTGAVAKQTNLSNVELRALGNGVADYLAVSKSMGKSNIETQNDLNEYIKTGNTTQLERDSILKNQMKTLDDQKTVSDRILALNKALKDEGYSGLSQLDIASIKAEELKGKFQLTATELGNKILPYIERFLDFMLELDKNTKGQSTMWLLIGGAVLAAAVALGPMVWAVKQMSGGVKDIVGGFDSIGKKAKDFALPSKKKVKIDCEKDKDCDTTCGGGSTVGGKKGKSSGPQQKTGRNIATTGTALGTLTNIGAAMGAIAVASAAAGGALKTVNDALGGTHEALMNMINLFPMGSSTGGLIGAGLFGENVSAIDMLRSIFPPLNMAISSFNAVKGAVLGVYGAAKKAYDYIKGGVKGAVQIAWGPIKSAYDWAKRTYNYIRRGVSGAVHMAYDSLKNAYNWAVRLYNKITNGASGRVTVNTRAGAVASAGPGTIGLARGPNDWYNGLSLNYQNYAGHAKNAINGPGCLTGNCVDMSMGLMQLNNGRGSLVAGTWDGGPHVWYQDANGKQWDPARKALQNTWMPPARGPSNNTGQIIIQQNFQGGIYGDQYIKQVAHQAAQNGVQQATIGRSDVTGGY